MDLAGSDYVIQGVLGEGSFAQVFKLEHIKSHRQFAGKYLKQVFKSKADIISCTEINVMKRIEDHPNILGLKDIICDVFPCNIILVFELMDMNLYEYLKDKQKPLTESSARNIFHQIICGIEHLHSNGIFHRDIKPENVLLNFPVLIGSATQDIRLVKVKLADFGSVKGIEDELPFTEYIATRWYRAPECILTTGYYGPKMDVWSGGCVFYEMLTLKPLFTGRNDIDQLDKIHKILGSPSVQVLRRFKHRKIDIEFPDIKPSKTLPMLENMSKLGIRVIKSCLTYLPHIRIDSLRLRDHYYFSNVGGRSLLKSSPSKIQSVSTSNLIHTIKPTKSVSMICLDAPNSVQKHKTKGYNKKLEI